MGIAFVFGPPCRLAARHADLGGSGMSTRRRRVGQTQGIQARATRQQGGNNDGRRRPQRVAELLRRELSAILPAEMRKAKGPGMAKAMVTVVDVDISDDLRNAKVTVSVGSNDEALRQAAVNFLKTNRRTIRYNLAQQTKNMRAVPELYFKEGEIASVFATLDVLASLKREREGRERQGESTERSASKKGQPKDLQLDASEDEDNIFL